MPGFESSVPVPPPTIPPEKPTEPILDLGLGPDAYMERMGGEPLHDFPCRTPASQLEVPSKLGSTNPMDVTETGCVLE